MTCQEVIELMQRDLDHDLNENEMAILHTHLQSCADCEEAFVRMKQISEELTMLPKVNPPYSLVDEILPQLEEQTNREVREVSSGIRWTQSAYVRVIGGLAAAALLLIMVFNDTPLNPLNNTFNSGMNSNDSAILMSGDAGSAVKEFALSDENMIGMKVLDQSSAGDKETSESINNEVEFHASSVTMTISSDSLLESGEEQIISPNGQYSAILNKDGTQYQIDIVSADGQAVYSSRTFEAEHLFNLHWSEDSKYFYYELKSDDVTSKASISIE